LAEIRRSIQQSPLRGEGHCKVWGRRRVRQVRTSMRRVLRLMRANHLLAPQRRPQPVEPKRHDGTILAERPNQVWGLQFSPAAVGASSSRPCRQHCAASQSRVGLAEPAVPAPD
jgi:putative transposase